MTPIIPGKLSIFFTRKVFALFNGDKINMIFIKQQSTAALTNNMIICLLRGLLIFFDRKKYFTISQLKITWPSIFSIFLEFLWIGHKLSTRLSYVGNQEIDVCFSLKSAKILQIYKNLRVWQAIT